MVACTEKENVVNETQKPSYTLTQNSYDSIGIRHNEIVDYYKCVYQENISDRFFYHDSISYLTIEAYDNLIDALTDYTTNTLGYSLIEVNNVILQLDSFNTNFGLYSTINNLEYVKILKDYDGAINYYNNLGLLSQEAYNAISIFYPDTEFGIACDFEEKIDSLEISQIPNWSNQNIASFLSVYHHSKDFWADPITYLTDPLDPLPCAMNPNQAIIAADCYGACVGVCLGGLFGGSIVAALYSCAEAEDQENGVSVLVGSEYPESRYYVKK